MKRISPNVGLAALLFLFIITIQALGVSPDKEAKVIATVKTAFKDNNPHELLGIYCLDGVEEHFKKETSEKIVRTMQNVGEITEIHIIPAETGAPPDVLLQGKTYRINLPVVKDMIIQFADKGHSKNMSLELPLGEKDGMLLIPIMAPVK